MKKKIDMLDVLRFSAAIPWHRPEMQEPGGWKKLLTTERKSAQSEVSDG